MMMDPMVGTGSGCSPPPVTFALLRSSPPEEDNSNSNYLSLLEVCCLCNRRFLHQPPTLDTRGPTTLSQDFKEEELLQAFFEDFGFMERSLLRLCPTCKPLCHRLSEAKDLISTLIDELTSLLRRNRKIPSSHLLSKGRVVSRLFQTKLAPLTLESPTSSSNYLQPLSQLAELCCSTSKDGDSSHSQAHPISSSFEIEIHFDSSVQGQSVDHFAASSIPTGKGCFSSITLNQEEQDPPPLSQFTNLLDPLRKISSVTAPVEKGCFSSIGEAAEIEIPEKTVEETVQHKYPCTLCPKSFKSSRNLSNHRGFHLKEKPFMCEICGASYRQKRGLEGHVALHRGESPFECQHCKKTFTQKSGLQRHLPIHTGETAFQCHVCGKGFLYHSSFAHHKKIHAAASDPPNSLEFRCQVCEQSFISSTHLKRHNKIHTGEKPFSCEFCDKSFRERFNLKTHVKTVHRRNTPYKCRICKLGFNAKDKLTTHLIEFHPVNSEGT